MAAGPLPPDETCNVDDLQSIATEYLNLRKEEVARCEKIIGEKVAALLTQQNSPR